MGIIGLLSYVKKACYEGNLSEFKGKTLLIDVSCLLHRGVFGCAGKLAMGQETDLYIGYVNKFVKILLAQDCHLILVFDGRPLPAKKNVDDGRRELREKYQKLGAELLSQGLTAEAHRAFGKGTTLTREVIEKTIRTFSKMQNVDIIVAPYEADAQIAYMMQKGYAHAVITEDSDMIVYGCEKIIFKMDPTSGRCVLFEKSKLANCVCPLFRSRFEFATFRRICILAGCDYLQGGLQGVGLKTAEEIFTKASRTASIHTILTRLRLYTSKRIKVRVDERFIDEFVKAENTFLHQIVFDPIKREQCPLNPYPNEDLKENLPTSTTKMTNYNYAGKIISSLKAIRLALGNADVAGSSLEDEFILPAEIPDWSIWHENYKNRLEQQNERSRQLVDAKYGAFKPKKSPLKRPAPLSSFPHHSSCITREDDIEVTFPKKSRFTDVKGIPGLKNGAYLNWTAKDWMRIYGVEKHQEQRADSSCSISESQASESQGSKSSENSI